MYPLTLGYLSIPELSAIDLISAASEAGFSSVGIRVSGRRPADVYTGKILGDKTQIREIRSHAVNLGVRISNISAYHIYPDIEIDDLKLMIETGAELGSDIIVATCQDPNFERMVERLGLYSDLAAAAAIKIAIENVAYSETGTVEKAFRVVNSVRQDNLGLLIDPLHLARAGETPAVLASIPEKHIVFAQLCDAAAEKPADLDLPGEARTRRLFPGEGALPLVEFLQALPASLEIEAEIPTLDTVHLPGTQRAKVLFNKMQNFLSQHRRT
jgi:sugar phosphate isomerase/epimerase